MKLLAGDFLALVAGVHVAQAHLAQLFLSSYNRRQQMEGPVPPWLLDQGARGNEQKGYEGVSHKESAPPQKKEKDRARHKKNKKKRKQGELNKSKGKEPIGKEGNEQDGDQIDGEGGMASSEGEDGHFADKSVDKPAESELTCPICMGDYEERDLFVFTPCLHAYCLQCVTQYYLTKMEEEEVLEIHCPFPKCETVADLSDIASVLEHDKFVEFQELRSTVLVKTNPECRYCPRPDCGHAQIGDPSVIHMVCDLCQYDYCYNCRDKWHEGISCMEFQATQAPIDEKTLKWKKKHGVRKCPNCGIEIFKFSGCPRMKCRNCQHTFHWKHGNPMGDTYPNGGFDQEESSFLNMGVTYPVQMRWMLGEYADEVKEQKTREGKRNKVLEAIGLGLLATVILLPIFVVAGPPVGTYRGVKKIGRGVKRIASRKTRTSSADNVEEAEATAK